MVPPIYTGKGVPIVRKGLQQTYVFHKDGIETFVIRPGYEGKVEDFGMLIPFPTPPSVRKVPDNIFSQIANAVDPPEVVIDLNPKPEMAMNFSAPAPSSGALGIRRSKSVVRVLREEAVGMYEVAVLEAGSAEALKKWMDVRGYTYPKGMDKVTNEYIEQKWCFVAVKTKVTTKSSTNPKPAQRKVSPSLPSGAVFDGNVQAMGFRFKSEELVVPMRLSAFNGGSLRNIIYLLTDGPKKVQAIPEEFVQRQIPGIQLYRNMTEPLPLRILGGELKDLQKWHKDSLKKRRDPAPKNALAKELFALDLLAASSKKLSMEHEETEKQLLQVSEFFGMRGEEFDRLNGDALKKSKAELIGDSASKIEEMMLTVVDGDFPKEVLANQNLKFAKFDMPKSKNNARAYDSKINGPQKRKAQGKLYYGSLEQILTTESNGPQYASRASRASGSENQLQTVAADQEGATSDRDSNNFLATTNKSLLVFVLLVMGAGVVLLRTKSAAKR